MPILVRAFVVLVALQIFVDLLGILAFFAMEGPARIAVLIAVLIITLIWDVIAVIYLMVRSFVAALLPAQARLYRSGLFTATFAALLTLVGLLLLVVPFNLPYWWTFGILLVILILILIQDISTSYVAIR